MSLCLEIVCKRSDQLRAVLGPVCVVLLKLHDTRADEPAANDEQDIDGPFD